VYFLNSEPNYKTDGNFTLFIPKAGAAKFKKAGIDDPAEHFNGKKVRATGTVKLYKERPEIVVEDAKQIELIDKVISLHFPVLSPGRPGAPRKGAGLLRSRGRSRKWSSPEKTSH
jgi:hypothetical protein